MDRSLVRPHLEYCVQAWCRHLVKDVELLENVRRWFTKLIDGMYGLSYEQCLLELDMTSLQVRRMRGDLIQVFKMVKGIDNVCLNDFFTMCNTNLRRHDLKFYKQRFLSNTGKISFTSRVVDAWNRLPDDMLSVIL